MKVIIFAAFAALLFASSAIAAPGYQVCDNSTPANCVTVTGNKLDVKPNLTAVPLGHQGPITLAIATALTPTATATIADITVEQNATYNSAIRCWTDGGTPTANEGLEILAGGTARFSQADLSTVKCIQETVSGAIDVEYSK